MAAPGVAINAPKPCSRMAFRISAHIAEKNALIASHSIRLRRQALSKRHGSTTKIGTAHQHSYGSLSGLPWATGSDKPRGS